MTSFDNNGETAGVFLLGALSFSSIYYKSPTCTGSGGSQGDIDFEIFYVIPKYMPQNAIVAAHKTLRVAWFPISVFYTRELFAATPQDFRMGRPRGCQLSYTLSEFAYREADVHRTSRYNSREIEWIIGINCSRRGP